MLNSSFSTMVVRDDINAPESELDWMLYAFLLSVHLVYDGN